MDTLKTGALIRRLRVEHGLTQRELAEAVGVGDKAVSKWERGGGCPDVALLPALAKHLGTTVETLLSGSLSPDRSSGGSMKRIAFYLCPTCGNIITTTGNAEVSCCGRKLDALEAQHADDSHRAAVKSTEGDWHIELDHPMAKNHSIAFVAVVGYDRLALEKLYPEQGCEARLPHLGGGVLYTCCTRHGLMRHDGALT